jgi:hypothetical protein
MSKLEQAIDCNDGDQAAKIIQDALGIESDDVASYVLPKTWPADGEQRARIIGEWLQTEARFLGRGLINAPSRQPQVRFQGEADMNQQARLAGSVKNDPKRS